MMRKKSQQPLIKPTSILPVDPGTKERLKRYRLEPDAKGPYEPNQSTFSIGLPESMFASVFLLPLLVDAKQRNEGYYFRTLILPQYMSYIICLVFQVSFMVFVHDFVSDIKVSHCSATSEKGHWYLRMLCLALIVAVVIIDIVETALMILWIRAVPDYDPKLSPKIINYCRENCGGRTSIPFQDYTNQEGATITKPAAGITQTYRAMTYIFVILPKLLLGLALLIFGTKYVLSAESNGDLMFNALGMVFVFDLDDIIYKVLTSPLHKKWLQTSSEISFDDSEISTVFLYQSYLGVAGVIVISMAIWSTFCQ